MRLDTSLVGLEGTSWVRGQRSFIFREANGEMSLHEVDHDAKTVRSEKSHLRGRGNGSASGNLLQDPEETPLPLPSEPVLAQRMRTPVMLTSLDTQSIKFDRVRTGLIWRSDRVDVVSGCNCHVYTASNLTFVTRSRTEHLTDNDKVNKPFRHVSL